MKILCLFKNKNPLPFHIKYIGENEMGIKLSIRIVIYLISEIPPIKGSGLALPFTALTIPRIANTKTNKVPRGPIINHPMNGMMLDTIEIAIHNKSSTSP